MITKEYDSEEKVHLSTLICSNISVIRPNRSVNVVEVNHNSSVNNKPFTKHHHTESKPQYDTVGENCKYWFIQHRLYTNLFETEDSNVVILCVSDCDEDVDDNIDDENTSNVSNLFLFTSRISKNYFYPMIQYVHINKDYYIIGRWKTYRYETEE